MKRITLLSLISFLIIPFMGEAQETVTNSNVSGESVNMTDVKCKTYTSSSWRNNWFLQFGAGIDLPFVENFDKIKLDNIGRKLTPSFNLSVGHWFSPYLALRFSALGGKFKWNSVNLNKGNYASLNFDMMWDMFNSLGGINTNRVFSIIPFVGLGGAYSWNLQGPSLNIASPDGVKHTSWTFPLSAGLQFRFRLSKYVDFFLEGRTQFLGDNFNGCEYDLPIDINATAIGGFTINFGGKKFQTANPCDYISYINQLNDQANNLRGQIQTTSAALAAAEAQLPCPEVKSVECPEGVSPMLGAVRFTLNSSKISKEEMVNIYNIAEWMKANPNVKVLVNGYADKGTGTSAYNQKLSEKRAQNVYNQMIKYGVDKSNLTLDAHGSSVQPYVDENNWNRIVLFTIK